VRAIRVLCFVAAMGISALAFGQEPAKLTLKMGSKEWTELEKTLWDVDQQWLCSAGATPYHKDYKECVEFRSQFWTDQFFEISIKGKVQTKAEMIAMQRAAHPSKGVGPHTDDIKLMAVYGNVALATDHTFLQSDSADGKVSGTETRVLRMFAKEDGKWRPAGAALVPVIQ
jgi:ketosteroid isomerase-like protein